MAPFARVAGPYKYTLVALALLSLASSGILMLGHQTGVQHPQKVGRSLIPVATATPRPAVPDDPLVPPGLAGNWQPIFRESFNGQALDTARWNTCFWWDDSALGCDGSVANGELQRYLPENVTVSNGALDIVARQETYSTDAKTYSYTSGLVTTEGKFAFRYGYVEARIRLMAGKGIWPAFWLLPQDHSSTNELDIAEILCDQPDVVNTAVHYLSNGLHASVGGTYQGARFDQEYHVVAVDWEPASITWYVDGTPFYQVTSVGQIPQKDMYLLLNTAIGGYWSGNPDQTTAFPHHFQVDWVQVWQHA